MCVRERFKKIAACALLAAFGFFPFDFNLKGEKEEGWFPFSIPWDYCEDSRADMSFLLDAPAGKHGFVKVKDGHFYFEDGKRAKFWGVNLHSNKACFPTHAQAEDISKRLAQLGCNIVRMHLLDNEAPGGIIDPGYNDSQHLSSSQLERLDYFIYQLKEKGIYVTFDVLGLGVRRFKKDDGVIEHDRIRWGAGGISFFDRRIMDLSRKFAKDFLTHVNPYTGNSYIDEPSVAMVEMTNENTLFADWITTHFTPFYKREIEAIWSKWLEDNGRTKTGSGGNWESDREFKFELQNEYQKDMYSYLRSLGVKCPIGSSNYTHDNLTVAADSNMDFTDVHPYWDHPYRLTRVHNRPLIRQSHLNPKTIVNTMSMAKVEGKPLIVTEWDSIWPNEWRAVDVLTTASYAALNDLDALFLYSYNGGWEMSWDGLEDRIYYPTVVFNDPAKMGIFPLASLIFLRQDAKVSLNSYTVPYSLGELFDAQDAYPDRLRLAGIMYISRLGKKFDEAAAKETGDEYSVSFEGLFDDKDKVVSDTGEITRDFKKGIFTLDTPRAYSFSGFIGNNKDGNDKDQDTQKAGFFTEADFSTFTVVSMDGKDIPSSQRLLVSILGRAGNKGQKLAPHISKGIDDLERDVYIIDNGDAPILVQGIDGEVFLRKSDSRKDIKVFSLDEKGRRKSAIPVKIDKKGYSFKVSKNDKTIYYEIVR